MLDRALEAAEEALRCEGLQQDALLVKAIALRGKPEQRDFLERTLERLPLAHALRYELEGMDGIRKLIVNELSAQTYLELGSWYEETGLAEDAKGFFRQALPDPEAEIRLAFLEKRAPVLSEKVAGVYPFRRESLPALEAAAQTAGWKGKYLLAVLKGFFRRRDEALALLESCGDEPDEAVFYIYRARVRGEVEGEEKVKVRGEGEQWNVSNSTVNLQPSTSTCSTVQPSTFNLNLFNTSNLQPESNERIRDLLRAKELGDGWRIGRDLVETYEASGDLEKMLAVARDYLGRHPAKNPIQIGYARALMKLGRYEECMAFLEGVKILPSEHRDSATEIWQGCQKALGLPLTWPENLGKGEPYHDGEWRQKG